MAVTSERLMFHRKAKNRNDLKSSESDPLTPTADMQITKGSDIPTFCFTPSPGPGRYVVSMLIDLDNQQKIRTYFGHGVWRVYFDA